MEENREVMDPMAAKNTDLIIEQNAVQSTEAVPVKPEPKKEAKWGDKTVTRRFMIIALAIAVALNAALTAGVAGALLKKQAKNRPDMNGPGRPGSEMFSGDQNGNGGMMPPGSGQNGSEQGQSQGSEQSSKASIGIIIKDDSGVYIAQVTGDNAKKAGFKEGDKIVSIDGKDVNSSSDLISEVQSHKAGDTVSITVERDGQSVEITTKLE